MINLMPKTQMHFQRHVLLVIIGWLISWVIAAVFVGQWYRRLHVLSVAPRHHLVKTSPQRTLLPISSTQLQQWREQVLQRHHRVEQIWQTMRSLPASVQVERVACQASCEWIIRSKDIKRLQQMPAVMQMNEQEGGWYRAHVKLPW